MKRSPWILFLCIGLLSASARSDDSLSNIEKELEKSIDLIEKWTSKNAKKFEDGLENALNQMESKLKKARDHADEKANHSLDQIEKKLKDLNRRLEEMSKEKEPDKEKARQLHGDVQKVSKELDQTK